MEINALEKHLQQLTAEAVKHIITMEYGAKKAEKEIHLRHGVFPYL